MIAYSSTTLAQCIRDAFAEMGVTDENMAPQNLAVTIRAEVATARKLATENAELRRRAQQAETLQSAYSTELSSVRAALGISGDQFALPAIDALHQHIASGLEQFRSLERENKTLAEKVLAYGEHVLDLRKEHMRLSEEKARLEAEAVDAEARRRVLAEQIRNLPFAPDTTRGSRQGWMRECAACLVEGKPLPDPPEPQKVAELRALVSAAAALNLDEPSAEVVPFPRTERKAERSGAYAGEIVWYCAKHDERYFPAIVTDFIDIVGDEGGEVRPVLEVFGLHEGHEERRPIAMRGTSERQPGCWYPRS